MNISVLLPDLFARVAADMITADFCDSSFEDGFVNGFIESSVKEMARTVPEGERFAFEQKLREGFEEHRSDLRSLAVRFGSDLKSLRNAVREDILATR